MIKPKDCKPNSTLLLPILPADQQLTWGICLLSLNSLSRKENRCDVCLLLNTLKIWDWIQRSQDKKPFSSSTKAWHPPQ